MRAPTALAAALLGGGALTAAWHAGLSPAPTVMPGVRVQSAPAPAPAGRATSTGSGPSGGTPSSRAHKPGSSSTPKSGSVAGALVATPYGDVQVKVVYSGRRITDVVALHLTDSSGTSVAISDQAAPILRREALAAQSAQVDTVSGATYTSEGYRQSLQAALDAAHLGG